MEKLRFSRIWLGITAKVCSFFLTESYRWICSFRIFRHFLTTSESGTTFKKCAVKFYVFKTILLLSMYVWVATKVSACGDYNYFAECSMAHLKIFYGAPVEIMFLVADVSSCAQSSGSANLSQYSEELRAKSTTLLADQVWMKNCSNITFYNKSIHQLFLLLFASY